MSLSPLELGVWLLWLVLARLARRVEPEDEDAHLLGPEEGLEDPAEEDAHG